MPTKVGGAQGCNFPYFPIPELSCITSPHVPFGENNNYFICAISTWDSVFQFKTAFLAANIWLIQDSTSAKWDSQSG